MCFPMNRGGAQSALPLTMIIKFGSLFNFTSLGFALLKSILVYVSSSRLYSMSFAGLQVPI